MAKINHKHKTVGVSFCPLLRQAASRRARHLGVSFSRYVGLCVEAEITGEVQLTDLQKGVGMVPATAMDGQGAFAASADERLRRDVTDLLERAQITFAREAPLGAMMADFFIDTADGCAKRAVENPPKSGGRSAEAGALHLTASAVAPPALAEGIVIECCYPSAQNHAMLLGRAVMLQQFCHAGAMLMCMPYLSLLDPVLHAVFARQRITIVTPDTLLAALAGHIGTR